MKINLHEDSGGGLQIQAEGASYFWSGLEAVPHGQFAEDAEALADGDDNDWTVDKIEGTPECEQVATWHDGQVTIERNDYDGRPLAGAAARMYVGIEDD